VTLTGVGLSSGRARRRLRRRGGDDSRARPGAGAGERRPGTRAEMRPQAGGLLARAVGSAKSSEAHHWHQQRPQSESDGHFQVYARLTRATGIRVSSGRGSPTVAFKFMAACQ
jgi:hypothetical protein